MIVLKVKTVAKIIFATVYPRWGAVLLRCDNLQRDRGNQVIAKTN